MTDPATAVWVDDPATCPLEFDGGTRCSLCGTSHIGGYLTADGDYDRPTFREYLLVTEPDGTLTRLCEDCADTVAALAPAVLVAYLSRL